MQINRKTTRAPADHIALAQQIGTQKGKPVHPDILVEPTCSASIDLRKRQEERRRATS